MSTNKEKSPIWGIVMTVVFGLTTVIVLYNLIHALGSNTTWAYANQFPLYPFMDHNYNIYNAEGTTGFNISKVLYILSSLCLLTLCALAILKKDSKNKLIIFAFIAFAAIQFIYYGTEFTQIAVFFIKEKIPLKEWYSRLYYLANAGHYPCFYSSSYLWECLWRMLISGILLLYALRCFIPAIDRFLSGNFKQTIFNVCTVIFLFSLAFLPSTSLHSLYYSRESTFLDVLPFYIATLGLWCQTAIFIWFIKE